MPLFTTFAAVNSGYDAGTNHVTGHDEAQEIVTDKIFRYPVDNVLIYPARVVWSTTRGCQAGGSPCGFVQLDDVNAPYAVSVFDGLKSDLQLTTLGVTGQETDLGDPSLHYSAQLKGMSIIDAASKWQETMEEIFQVTGMEVSAGFWQDGDHVHFDSTLNPLRYSKEEWQEYNANLSGIFKTCFPETQLNKHACRYRYLSDKSAKL